MSEEKNYAKPGEFSWNELIAADETGQKELLHRFVRLDHCWKPATTAKDQYTLFKKGATPWSGGMMKTSEARRQPTRTGSLMVQSVEDVDAARHQGPKTRRQNRHRSGGIFLTWDASPLCSIRKACPLFYTGRRCKPFSRRNAKERCWDFNGIVATKISLRCIRCSYGRTPADCGRT